MEARLARLARQPGKVSEISLCSHFCSKNHCVFIWLGPVAEISLERSEISLTRMEISPYKYSQAG